MITFGVGLALGIVVGVVGGLIVLALMWAS